jgi:hypothetical protein
MSRGADGRPGNVADDATLSPPAVIAAIECQGSEVRRLKASGLGNKDALVVAAVAELKRLKAQLTSASSNEIKQDENTGDSDFAAFREVYRHRSLCIHWLITFAQRIERIWCVGLPWSAGLAGV